jgi:hypothetical protein
MHRFYRIVIKIILLLFPTLIPLSGVQDVCHYVVNKDSIIIFQLAAWLVFIIVKIIIGFYWDKNR